MDQHKQTHQNATQRQGYFRCIAIFAATAALVGGIGFQAHAHGGHGFRGGMFSGPVDPAKLDERAGRMVKHLAVEINATPEQQQRLLPIVKQAITEMQPLRAQLYAVRKQVKELMSAESIDRGALERLRVEKLQVADALSRHMTQAMADAAEVLTPAQRKQLAEKMQRGRRHHGQGHRG